METPPQIELYDSHAHPGELCTEGVKGSALAAAQMTDWQELTARESERCVIALGVHPWHAGEYNASRLRAALEADSRRCVGETGLDFSDGITVPREIQLTAFRSQAALAAEYQRPLIVHLRHAWADFERVMTELSTPPPSVILHAFNGSPEQIRQYCRHPGWFFSFGFALLKDKIPRLARAAAAVPPERLLIESDYPANRAPAQLGTVIAKLAQLRAISTAQLGGQLAENWHRAFRIAASRP